MNLYLFISIYGVSFYTVLALNFSNHTLVLVSGWPQSGTSLVQQIFTGKGIL